MQYLKNRPFFKDGIGVDRLAFSGGRLAVEMVRHGGLSRIIYFGNQRGSDAEFFHADPLSAWMELFRPAVRFDDLRRYALEFHDTVIYPNGFSSSCEFEGVKFRHELILGNQEMMFRLTRISGGEGRKIVFELINTDVCTRTEKPIRSWKKLENPFPLWKITDQYPEAAVAAEQQSGYLTLAQRGEKFVAPPARSETFFGICGTAPVLFRETPWMFRKHYYAQELNAAGAVFVLGFGHADASELRTRLQKHAEVPETVFRFPDGETSPKFQSNHPVVDSFLANAPDILDSYAVADVPGGMRAADSGYWIWGWDTMVWADAFGELNRLEQMAGVLDFYSRTASRQSGIFHEMHPDLRPYKSMAFAPQCLYAVMLYKYFVYSGNAGITGKYLKFAEEIVARAGEFEVGESGLLRGVSLYPDHPEDLEQDGNDISVFNNSIYYQALRALEELEKKMGTQEKSSFYHILAERTRRGFEKFYDSQAGYFCDSLSAEDFSMRRHYPVYAILYVTEFAEELLNSNRTAVAEFMVKKFSTRHGCRILPLDDSAFLRDGNQLGMYMPSTERFYRVMCHAINPDWNLEKFKSDLIENWELLTLPEALTCEYENHGITPDNPGRKQFFTLKPWVDNWFVFALGIHCDLSGIHFSPFAESGTAVSGLLWHGKTIRIRNCGSSGKVIGITINGKAFPSPECVRWDELPDSAEIIVLRSQKNKIQ